MSEIEKMYENTRVYDFRYDCDVSFSDGDFGRITNCSKGEIKDYCTDKKYFKGAKVINVRHLYPPFTAEKQLEIMELLVRKGMLLFTFSTKGNYKVCGFCRGSDYCSDIKEAFANYINNIWQDLTEEEKQQVKGILE